MDITGFPKHDKPEIRWIVQVSYEILSLRYIGYNHRTVLDIWACGERIKHPQDRELLIKKS